MTLDPNTPAPIGRRAQRRADKRRRQQRIARIVAVVTGLALLLVGGGVALSHLGGSSKKSGAQRTQRTLLLQIKGPDGTAVGSVLLAHDWKANQGAAVLVQPEVIAAIPGSGTQTFGKALLLSAQASRDALSDLMGVTIDGSWVLDVKTFERMIDQVGGVQVKVDTQISANGIVLLQPGQQKLSGAGAYTFLTYLASGEDEAARLARLQAVLDGFITALPASPTALIGSLGAGSSTTFAVPDLGTFLHGLAKDDAAQNLQYRPLPVLKLDVGTDATRYRVDTAGVQSLADDLLAQSVPPGARATGNRVLVLNGVGTPGLGLRVRDRLVQHGFVFVGSRNAPSFGYPRTLILVKDASAAADVGARLANVLGVPESAVETSDQIGTIADVVVIIGKDYRAS